ncbi:MAG: hypothetical protein LUG99_01020 [Lachnospiraceae bacterium]|nr:hypothetical protein [Lachnospiraceae bacterium]
MNNIPGDFQNERRGKTVKIVIAIIVILIIFIFFALFIHGADLSKGNVRREDEQLHAPGADSKANISALAKKNAEDCDLVEDQNKGD